MEPGGTVVWPGAGVGDVGTVVPWGHSFRLGRQSVLEVDSGDDCTATQMI